VNPFAPVREPVLVMAFNRPDHLRRLLDRLREVKPEQIFVAVDGPRAHVPEEGLRVQECRELVSQINWPCNVQTLFQPRNLGCGVGVSTAITWFFDHVERGIILEDDIIPVPSFFAFCTELLDRYADDPRVFAVSGCNFVPPSAQTHPDLPYRFSQVPHIWGWATWKRSWSSYSLDIAGWPTALPPQRLWAQAGRSLSGAVYWASTFELLARKQVDTWDGQLVLASMITGAWTATSNVNLIQNIGFGEDATHTREDRDELQPVGQVPTPLAPVPLELDERADRWTRRHHFRADWRGIFRQAQTYLQHRGRPAL
jgi:hypothetical protein